MTTHSEAPDPRVDGLGHDQKIALVESALLARAPQSSDIECIRSPEWVQWIRRGVPSILTNRVWFSRMSEEEADQRIAKTVATYRALNLPLMWMLSPSTRPKNLSERLLAHGFRHLVDVRGMVARVGDILKKSQLTTNDAIRIEVVNESNIEEWLAIYARGWNVNEEAKDAVRKEMHTRFAQNADKSIDILARYEGRPCGSASLAIFDNLGLFMNGFVDPEVRQRGIFRAMVVARAAILQGRSIPHAVIHALAHSAAPLMCRMGFEDICAMSAYTYP